MSTLSVAAHMWLESGKVHADAAVAIIDGGIARARRTGVAHHLADAAEVTVGDETTLAARWLCGGKSVNAVMAGPSVDCMNCRLSAATPRRPCVYYAWGEGEDELLYVGSSINVAQRIRGHMTQTAWWPEVRRLTFDEYATEHEARQAEFEAIAARPGEYNREGVLRRPPQSPFGLVIGGEEL